MKKRLLSLILAVLMIVSLTACQGASTPSNDEANNTPANNDNTANDTPSVLKFSYYDLFTPTVEGVEPNEAAIQKDAEWQRLNEEYVGMPIEIERLPVSAADINERNAQFLAAGDFPDAFGVYTSNDVAKLADAGQIVNILDYDVPYYSAWLAENGNMDRVATPDGKVYCMVPGVESFGNIEQNFFAYNFEIFEENNIKIPETLDELYDAAAKLKEIYPDSYPIDACPGDAWGLEETIARINHTHKSIYYNDNEKQFIMGIVDEADVWKETLQYLNKMFEEGLINPDWYTQGWDVLNTNALTGKSFIYPNMWGGILLETINASPDKVGEWGIAIRPKGFDGKIGWRTNEAEGKSLVIQTGAQSGGICFNANAENLDLLIKLFDYQYSPEMLALTNWGVEGVQYEVVDGEKQFIATTKDEVLESYTFVGSTTPLIVNQSRDWLSAKNELVGLLPTYNNGVFGEAEYWAFSNEEGADAVDHDAYPIAAITRGKLTNDQLQDIAQIMTPIDTYLAETTLNLITGDMSFDEWDNIIATVEAMGYQDALAIYNEVLSQYAE